jgi:hypothetical protein
VAAEAVDEVDTFRRARAGLRAGDGRGRERYLPRMASWASGRSGDQALKPRRLVFVECGRKTIGLEKGWRAVLAGGVEDELEVAVYCRSVRNGSSAKTKRGNHLAPGSC